MAILQKRTSKKQLPDAKGIDRTPISSVVNNQLGNAPSLTSQTGQSITSNGSGSGTSNPTLTSTTGTSPSITNKTGAATSITTSPSTTTRPTITTKPTSSTASNVLGTLTKAAAGAGAGALISKVIGSAINGGKSPVGGAIGSVIGGNKTTPTKTGTSTPVTASNKEVADQQKNDPNANQSNLPSDAVANGDGTYYSIDSNGIKTTYDAQGSVTGAEQASSEEQRAWNILNGGSNTANAEDAQLAQEAGLSAGETMVNADGTTITALDDGNGNLMYVYGGTTADGLSPKSADTSGTRGLGGDTTSSDTSAQYFQDDQGNYYTMNADGGYDLLAYADGSYPTDTTSPDMTWTDPDTGATWTMAGDGTWNTDWVDPSYDPNADTLVAYDNTDNTDYTAKRGGLITMMKNGGGLHMADGGDVTVIDSVDNGDGTYTQYYSDGSEETFDNPTNATVYNPDGSTGTTPNTPITSAGGSKSWYSDLGNLLTKGATSATGLGSAALDKISGALGVSPSTVGAAGAGALVASLLGSDFSGGSGQQNQGLDMSKVGVINPRTTSFGVGPTHFVDYSQYGTNNGNYTPNAELLHNLNAPGYNPVNPPDAPAAETPKMASGGLSSMTTPVASYYTFGQPADILANLGMRQQPPQNPPDMMSSTDQQPKYPTAPAQQDGQPSPLAMAAKMPNEAPPQGQNPQGMPPQMARGGLPHVSNVPVVEGRMDFRNGSAVHGEGDGQSDDIPAMLADGEYVIDAETVAQIGNGSTKAGAQALDKFRESIRAHKRSAPVNKIPPKTKALTSYLKG